MGFFMTNVTAYTLLYGEVGEKVKTFVTINAAERNIKVAEIITDAKNRVSIDSYKTYMTKKEFMGILKSNI